MKFVLKWLLVNIDKVSLEIFWNDYEIIIFMEFMEYRVFYPWTIYYLPDPVPLEINCIPDTRFRCFIIEFKLN